MLFVFIQTCQNNSLFSEQKLRKNENVKGISRIEGLKETVLQAAQENRKEFCKRNPGAIEEFIAAKEGEREILSLEESQVKKSWSFNVGSKKRQEGTWFKRLS